MNEIEKLLKEITDIGWQVVGYADEVMIVVRGPFPQTIVSLIHQVLYRVRKWCNKSGSAINPQTIVRTRKYKKIDPNYSKYSKLPSNEQRKQVHIDHKSTLTYQICD